MNSSPFPSYSSRIHIINGEMRLIVIKPKRKLVFLILLAVLLTAMAACSPAGESTVVPSATSTVQNTATSTQVPTPTMTPTPTPTPLPLNGQQTQYQIDVTVNYYNRFVTARSHSIYTNKTDEPINEMMFIVYPTIFQNAIYIKSIKTGNGNLITDYQWESHRMVIPLETPLMPGGKIEFIHDFELYMPDREGTFGQTGRQLNLSYWFPYIPPRDENGWMAYEISLVNSQIVGEHLVFEAADFDVTLKFTDRRENMKVAAGALPQESEDGIHYLLKLARTFTISISDIYAITERQVDGITIRTYTFPEEVFAGEAAAEIAAQAIKLYSEIYGPLERDLLSVVEADFLHGMEFDGLILLSRGFFMFYNGTPETNLTIITPHETSHQWFFSQVGSNQALEPWLDESLATYSEALFYERYHPELVDWWWENRVDGLQPAGFVDNTIYLEGGYEEYRNSVYLNGAHFLQDLRDTIGDEAFFAFIKDYAKQYRYQIATSEDFWTTLKQHTDADLAPILEEYFSSAPAGTP